MQEYQLPTLQVARLGLRPGRLRLGPQRDRGAPVRAGPAHTVRVLHGGGHGEARPRLVDGAEAAPGRRHVADHRAGGRLRDADGSPRELHAPRHRRGRRLLRPRPAAHAAAALAASRPQAAALAAEHAALAADEHELQVRLHRDARPRGGRGAAGRGLPLRPEWEPHRDPDGLQPRGLASRVPGENSLPERDARYGGRR